MKVNESVYCNMNSSKQIKMNMKNQGRTMTWLMIELNLSRRTFYLRMKDDSWKIYELATMQALGVL